MSQTEKLSAIERLEDLLNEKDKKIEELEQEINDMENEKDIDPMWWIHREIKNAENLPIPRLELRLRILNESVSGASWEWVYALITQHLIGGFIKIPMGHTRSSGSLAYGEVHLPFRDTAHIQHDSEQLQLPAFAIWPGKIEQYSPEKNLWELWQKP